MLIINGNNIPYDLTSRATVPSELRGKVAFILKEGMELEEAQNFFGRADCCLKIFFTPLKENERLEDYYWGVAWHGLTIERSIEIGKICKLSEATAIQNLLWMQGYAPRAYGICLVEKDGKHYPAQLVQYLKGERAQSVEWVQAQRGFIEDYLKQFSIEVAHKELISVNDFIGQQLIDLQGFHFTNKTKEKIRKFVAEGVYGSGHYQSVPELDIGAHPRDTLKRIESMQLDKIDFEGKSVLDVGCNSGVFLNYASHRGARLCYGVDQERNIQSAKVLAFYLGNHNIDYVVADLLKPVRLPYRDITFFLSMNAHIGLPDWVLDTDVLIFEENAMGGNYKTEEWIKRLSNYFNEVKLIGYATDHNPNSPKPIILCNEKIPLS